MKTVKIQEELFKKILDGTKHCIEKDGYRPQLSYIRIEVKANSITAYALDGYRAGRVVISCEEKNPDEFICYIKPFSIKVNKGTEIRFVTLTLDDEKPEEKCVYAEVDTEYGKLRYCFEQKGLEWTTNIEEIFANAKIHDREIAVNSDMIAQMFKALSAVTANDRNNLCVIESKDSRLQAFCITAQAPDVVCEQLILPIRRAGDEEEYGRTQKTNEFLEIVKANPDLPIVPMVDCEVCAGDDYGWWLGSFGKAEVTEYTTLEMYGDGRFITRGSQDEAEEFFADKILDEHPELSDEEVEKQAHEKAEALPWVKAIVVWIGLPED